MKAKLSGDPDNAIFNPESILPEAVVFDKLKRSGAWKFYRRLYHTLTGMPIFLEPVNDGEGDGATKDREAGFSNPFCRMMNPGRNPVCAHCPLSGLGPEDPKSGSGPLCGVCDAGLQEDSVAIHFQNRPVARLWSGGVTLSRPAIESFSIRASRVWMVCPAAKIGEAAEAWRLSPVVSREQLEHYRSILRVIAERLSLRINRALLEDDPRDPGWMRAVKECERQAVIEVAPVECRAVTPTWEAAFGIAGGMGYREYAARCRLERACRLLLHRDSSPGSIAKSAGYESVEALDRSTIQLLGESAEVLRERLIASQRALSHVPAFSRTSTADRTILFTPEIGVENKTYYSIKTENHETTR